MGGGRALLAGELGGHVIIAISIRDEIFFDMVQAHLSLPQGRRRRPAA
jgi:hypothetical protein